MATKDATDTEQTSQQGDTTPSDMPLASHPNTDDTEPASEVNTANPADTTPASTPPHQERTLANNSQHAQQPRAGHSLTRTSAADSHSRNSSATPTPQPLTTPATDEEKAKKLAESLKTTHNNNTAYFINHSDQHRVALWTKGITAPTLGKTGELIHKEEVAAGQRYVDDYLPFNTQTSTMGWYDADKSPHSTIADINLCFAAVAANQLHWWMAQNTHHITQYLTKTNYGANLSNSLVGGLKDVRTYRDSFKNQQDSAFFTMFKAYFGNNREGYQVDPLIDLFVNGYTPKPNGGANQAHWPPEFTKDTRGGFFHEVFGRKLLTDRLTTRQFDYFANQLKLALQNGKSVGVIYAKGGGYSHVITAWGAEFDPNGKLTALYVTDSDDQTQSYNGLRRISIKNIDGQAALSNNIDNPRHGSKIDSISTLSLGDAHWAAFLK
ncbi:MAG: IdeS/Mac family cysteine endopeptidase [Candidatus Saccharibacteria bacterium]|nr:IdeS/Mac family cysteine endopeptidase [Candidatus Saccharibacteria bacterium]